MPPPLIIPHSLFVFLTQLEVLMRIDHFSDSLWGLYISAPW